MPSQPQTSRHHLCAHCIRYGPEGQRRCPCSVELTAPLPQVPNMWVQGHGPAPQPQPQTKKRPGNPAAVAAIICAALGLLLSTVPLLRALLGFIALACGVLGERESRKHDARLGKLALLGALIGLVELVALFG